MWLSTQILDQIAHSMWAHARWAHIQGRTSYMMCAPYDTQAISLCPAYGLLQAHVRSNSTERYWVALNHVYLSATNRMCDYGVGSGSLRMFPMYREHQRRQFVQSNTETSGKSFWTVCRGSGQRPALSARRSSFTSDIPSGWSYPSKKSVHFVFCHQRHAPWNLSTG